MNNVVLIGRLTKDPELRYIQGTGNAMCCFTLAVDRGLSKDKKQEAEVIGNQTADFIRVKSFGKVAELCEEYLKRGLQTAVQGRIQTGFYTNQQGQRVYTTDVVAERVNFIEWPGKEQLKDNYDNQKGEEIINSENNFISYSDDNPELPF